MPSTSPAPGLLLAVSEDALRRILREELRAAVSEVRSPAADVLSIKQAAACSGLAPKTLRNWVSLHRLPAKHRGNRLVIQRSDLERVLAGGSPSPQSAAEDALEDLTGSIG